MKESLLMKCRSLIRHAGMLGGAMGLLLALCLVLGVSATPVWAIPPQMPHQFYGNVTIGEATAPSGVSVSASIGGVPYAVTTTDAQGRYGYSPLFKVPADDPDTQAKDGGVAGETIQLYVANTPAATATFQNGEITQLNLEIDATPPTVTTNVATNVSTTTATLNGSLDNLGTTSSVDVSFEWGTSTSYGNSTTAKIMASTGSFSASLSGLSPSTTYHFGAKAEGTGTSYGDDRTFTTSATGGGGGGGGAPSYTIDTNLFGQEGTNLISSTGEVLKTIEGTSSDGNLGITLPKGCTALGPDGKRLQTLNVNAYEDPPDPPSGANIIGLTYDFQPNGATFEDPPMVLTWHYDPDTLGDISEESLVLAYYDDDAGVWVELECEVDTENNTITAKVTHTTIFALLGTVPLPPPPAPAEFAVSGLVVTPGEVYIGESVSIKVLVANTGGESGSCNVTLKINGVVEEVKEVTVSNGLSKEVTFSASKDIADIYTIDVNGLLGSFTVKEKPAPPPAPAEFAVSGLVISPGEVYVGESVAIEVLAANTGGESGSYEVSFKINGVVEEARQVTLSPGSSEKVSLIMSRDVPGTYDVDVNGLTSSFTVKEKPEEVVPPPPGFNWPLTGGIIAAMVIAGLLIYFLVRRRRMA